MRNPPTPPACGNEQAGRQPGWRELFTTAGGDGRAAELEAAAAEASSVLARAAEDVRAVLEGEA